MNRNTFSFGGCGANVSSHVTGCVPTAVHIGMPVEVAFDDVSERWTLYSFTPREAT